MSRSLRQQRIAQRQQGPQALVVAVYEGRRHARLVPEAEVLTVCARIAKAGKASTVWSGARGTQHATGPNSASWIWRRPFSAGLTPAQVDRLFSCCMGGLPETTSRHPDVQALAARGFIHRRESGFGWIASDLGIETANRIEAST